MKDPARRAIGWAVACLLVPCAAGAQGAARPARPRPAASFDALAKKAEAAKEAGRYDEAIELYRKALALKPEWVEGRFALGTMLYDSDRFEDEGSALSTYLYLRGRTANVKVPERM